MERGGRVLVVNSIMHKFFLNLVLTYLVLFLTLYTNLILYDLQNLYSISFTFHPLRFLSEL